MAVSGADQVIMGRTMGLDGKGELRFFRLKKIMRKKAGSWQFAVYSLQPLDRNLPLRIFIAYCLLPIAYCLLPIAYCLLPIAYFTSQSSVLNGTTGNPSLLNKFPTPALLNEKRTATGAFTDLLDTINLSFSIFPSAG